MEKKPYDKSKIAYENNRLGFPASWGRCSSSKWMSVNLNNDPCLPRIIASRFADLKTVEEFVEDRVNEIKTKRGDFPLAAESIRKWNIDYFARAIFIYMLWE